MKRSSLVLLAIPFALALGACGGGNSDSHVNAPSGDGASSSGSSGSGSSSSGDKDEGDKGGSSAAGGGGDSGGKGAASDFSAPTVNGHGTVSLSALKGKVVIVDFWATWCEPCKKSFPKLQALNVKYKASGLEIVGVSEDDDKGGIPSFAANYGAKFPIVWDDGKKIANKWQPKSMPSTYIVDKTGQIRFQHDGYHDGEEATIEDEVKKLL